MLGQRVAMPVAIAPTGLAGLFRADGEILGARAAAAFGIPFCLSTLSICSIEDVKAATQQPFWFQQYLMRDRGFNQELMDRAQYAGCSALVLTLDLQVQGERRRDTKNGLAIPPKLTFKNAVDIASKPAWALKVLFGKHRSFGNLEGHIGGASGIRTLSEWIATQFDPAANWKDVEWVRSRWSGKLVLKGVLDPEDAKLALASGADGIVVSNHGGRQLDGAPSSVSVLAEIATAIDGRCEVLFDGGIRSGQDVLKALALGARGVLIGKSFLYALAAMGGTGVTRALEIIQASCTSRQRWRVRPQWRRSRPPSLDVEQRFARIREPLASCKRALKSAQDIGLAGVEVWSRGTGYFSMGIVSLLGPRMVNVERRTGQPPTPGNNVYQCRLRVVGLVSGGAPIEVPDWGAG